jgi:hypothetical protein
MDIKKLIYGLFTRPRCDSEVCDNPRHGRVHYGRLKGQPSAWTPRRLVVREMIEEIKDAKNS